MLYIILGLAALFTVFFIYIVYRIVISDHRIISLTFIPLLLGIIYENRRLSSNWKIIALKLVASLVFSFYVFLPDQDEKGYNFQNHLEVWPFWFLGIFVFISVLFHEKKTVARLTEGITMVLSISILYWLLDFKIFDHLNFFTWAILFVVFIIMSFSLINAFSHLQLGKKSRLFLSISSSLITMVFAFEFMFRIFTGPSLENANFTDGLIIIIQYFLLGISSMYILQNILMLAEYLPFENRFYNKEHMQSIRKNNETHIERYSNRQVRISDAVIALFYTVGIYVLNYRLQLVSSSTAIWIVLVTLPIIIGMKNRIFGIAEENSNA